MITPAKPSPLSLVLVGKHPDLTALVTEAQRWAFPHAQVEAAATVAAAAELRTPPEHTVLVLLTLDGTDLAAANASLDAHGLPRWAVVAFEDSVNLAATRDGIVVTRANWNAPALAQILGLALEVHGLRRKTLRCEGDFATLGTRVVHDLRSPLGGVLSTVEVLKEVLAEDAPERAALLDPILESTDGLTKLIRQIAVVTKASGQPGELEHFNMGQAFWAAFQRVEREALSLGATVAQSASWPEVEGNPTWVEVMWHAFLCNALQHAGPKPRIEAGWNRGVGENRFWLIDQGQVPLEKRASLFRPFHLLHYPNAPRGFGLSIVQRLAELQGGHSGYEVMPNGGSCFFFTLPFSAEERAAAEPKRG
jgi:K+-sensing histidine kinase KdpD